MDKWMMPVAAVLLVVGGVLLGKVIQTESFEDKCASTNIVVYKDTMIQCRMLIKEGRAVE